VPTRYKNQNDVFERQKHTSVTTTTVHTYDLKVSQQSNGNPLSTKYKVRRSGLNQVQSSQKWVEPNQRSVPTQYSNIRSLSGPGLSAHAKFNRPRNPKPHVLAKRDFEFWSDTIIIVTHRSANEKESPGRLGSPGLPDLPDPHLLATHRRKKLSHIWQPMMPKVRVENVEDEEYYNFILLKCPTVNKEF